VRSTRPAAATVRLLSSARAHHVRVRFRDDSDTGASRRADDGFLADADIRAGQDFPKLWAKWHYNWAEPNSVALTIVESDALEEGGFMSHSAVPRDRDSAVHGVWQQTSKSVRGLLAVSMMRVIGPRFLSS
jgi:hypothetical protein